MATHESVSSLLKESITEFLRVAEYSISFKKGPEWGTKQSGGCLGFPGTTLMFSIADIIGSYYRRKPGFSVLVDGRMSQIKNDSFHHFFIFNSSYYNLELSESAIKQLYNDYRSLLVHNGALAMSRVLFMGNPQADPFPVKSGIVQINVSAFLHASNFAVKRFLAVIDQVVPGSAQEQAIQKR
jgi:hypothetical protein